MLITKVYLKDIDYHTVVDIAMPYIVKWLSEKDNFFYEMLKNIISRKGKPTVFSKILISVLPKKSDMAASLLPHFDDVLIEYCNNLLVEKNMIAKITSISMNSIERRHETMLKIEVKIDDIDYEKTAVNLLPVLLERLNEKDDKSRKLVRTIRNMNELPEQVLTAAIRAIPLWKRDELVAFVLTEYKEEVSDMLKAVIIKNNIKADIKDFKIDHTK